ncbi:MAG: hypothetical protein WC876_12035 [Candidatus Thermoplasmatota archaeon]|jgi:hypothetical protein
MGQGRPTRSTRSRAAGGESAVTPVIGAILILAITILGIAGVLYWGAPMIERIQVQNAQIAVVGEFQDLRDASSVLSVPDHSRFPTIVIPRGEVALQEGSRIMVTSNRDAGFTNCDFHVTGWADTATPTTVSASTTNCRSTGVAVKIYQVSGATLVEQTVTGSYTVAGADFTAGDWVFRLTHSSDCGSDDICAEAWLLSGDRVTWDTDSSAGHHAVSFDSGAIFSDSDGTVFLQTEPSIGDTVFGSGYYGLWLRSLTASSYNSVDGAGSRQVYLSLLGNYDRVESSTVSRLRLDISGDLAEGWCNSLISRNNDLTAAAYVSTPVADCAGDADGVRSVTFERTGTTPFTFRFLHARIYASLAI